MHCCWAQWVEVHALCQGNPVIGDRSRRPIPKPLASNDLHIERIDRGSPQRHPPSLRKHCHTGAILQFDRAGKRKRPQGPRSRVENCDWPLKISKFPQSRNQFPEIEFIPPPCGRFAFLKSRRAASYSAYSTRVRGRHVEPLESAGRKKNRVFSCLASAIGCCRIWRRWGQPITPKEPSTVEIHTEGLHYVD